MRKKYLSLRADVRAFDNPSDMFGHCRKCGRQIVMLPDDRRYGYCFDCLDFLQIARKTEVGDGRVFTMPPENEFSMR